MLYPKPRDNVSKFVHVETKNFYGNDKKVLLGREITHFYFKALFINGYLFCWMVFTSCEID
ncbi:hypothetical protein OAG1_33100 [Agarivorans sp. OAG1]|nr:hypothetical protein OAG1_33100 [Agarivorans sp. OAG1]